MSHEAALGFAKFFSTLTLIGFIWLILIYAYHKIWPNRSDWEIDSSYKQSDPIGKLERGWHSNGIQKKGAYIVVIIAKGSQRARLIKRIQFIQGIKYRWAYPIKWRVTLQGESAIINGWDSLEQTERKFGAGIDIILTQPEMVHSIAITITKAKPRGANSPSRAMCWGFSDLRITEVRFRYLPHWSIPSFLREWVIA